MSEASRKTIKQVKTDEPVDCSSDRDVDIETGAEALFKLLQYHDVDYIFMSPGTDWRGLWDTIAKSICCGEKKPKYMQLLHEAHAVAMAIGYTAYTGRAQVVPFHMNVGLLHAAMEIHSAYRYNIPMLLMSSTPITYEGELKGSAEGVHYFNFQEFHMGNLVSPYVKWDYEVHTNLNLPKVVGRAFQMAYAQTQGPVHLLIPREIMEETVTKIGIPGTKPFSPPQLGIDVQNIEGIAKLLVNAKTPLIIAGGGFDPPMSPTAVQLLVELSELLAIPVVTSGTYVDFPTTHDLHVGFSSAPYVKDADVILVINSSTPWMPPSGPPETTKVIFLGPDTIKKRWPYWGFRAEPDLTIECDIACGLSSLIKAIDSVKRKDRISSSEFKERHEKWKIEHDKQRTAWLSAVLEVKDNTPIDHRWISYNIGQIIDEDTIVVVEAISCASGIDMYIPRSKPATKFGNFGAGGLGQGIGVAQGIKLAAPDKTVILLVGDGCFNYNPVQAGLWASKEYALPILIVIYNNGVYQSMGTSHLAGFPEGWCKKANTLPGAWLREYEYSKLAEAFNFHGVKIEDPALVNSELKKALNEVKNGKTAIVDSKIAKFGIPTDFKPATY
jgi:acetolactate synthase-1/2/3 large subunit